MLIGAAHRRRSVAITDGARQRGASLSVTVTDTITGHVATGSVAVTGKMCAGPIAEAVTQYRPDRIHAWLENLGGKQVTIVVDAGPVFRPHGCVSAPNEQLARDQRCAKDVAAALQKMSIQSQVVTSDTTAKELFAHPWNGKMAGARTRRMVPQVHFDGPVIFIGDAQSSWV